jgi:hypothetical protein
VDHAVQPIIVDAAKSLFVVRNRMVYPLQASIGLSDCAGLVGKGVMIDNSAEAGIIGVKVQLAAFEADIDALRVDALRKAAGAMKMQGHAVIANAAERVAIGAVE